MSADKSPPDDLSGRLFRFARHAVDHLSDAVFFGDETDRFVYVNQEACRSLGYDEQELLGMRVQDVSPMVSDEVRSEFFRQIRQTGKVRFESEHRTKDGRTFPVEIVASLVELEGKAYWCAFARDITDRKKVKEALRFTQFSVDNFVEAAYWMLPDATILYVNKAACQMLGYTEEELMEKKVYEINPSIDADKWAVIWNLLKLEKKRTFESEHQAKDGRIIPIEVSANLLEFDGREYSCAFIRDISERKEMELRLRHSEKMEAVGRLAGGVAHDFNNQLAGILGYADLLQSELKDNPALSQYTDRILAAANRASDLTAQLLAYSRKGKYVTKRVNFHDIIDEVADMLERGLDKRISIVKQLEAELPVIMGDPSQLQNAVLNLGINSRDAMEGRGTLSFITQSVELDDVYCSKQPYEILPGPYIRLTVSDTGKGMDNETMQRMFEPFFTTKGEGEGTGMGLAAVYGTVKHHKGAINVYSEVGRGTAISIYFPQTTGEALRLETKPPRAIDVVRDRSARILVVDDEPVLRDVAAQMLERMGCEVKTCENGQEAVKVYEQEWDAIDLVILDMVMPVMNGKDAFSAMKRINPEIKALLASGYALDTEAQSALNEGVFGFLQKPFRRVDLARMLDDVLGQLVG